MDLALYDPDAGYYARAARRTGRAGDFFTSVDVGPLFGELLEVQIAEMYALVARGFSAFAQLRRTRRRLGGGGHPRDRGPERAAPQSAAPQSVNLDLVEAGAGNGQLAADILDAMQRRNPSLYEGVRVHLVERSAPARAAQRDTLGPHLPRLASSSSDLPGSFDGVLVANELLDAMPVHQVVVRENGLREVYVTTEGDALSTCEGPPSTPALADYLERVGVELESGWRAEINLNAVDWIRNAARRLRRGFMMLIDYGHDARELYSVGHAGGTLTTFSGHRAKGAESPGRPAWLDNPGEQDLTAHVDFTSVRAAAEAEGLETIGFLDQTYFLMGLLGPGAADADEWPLQRRLALKTLIAPGGLGSTMKVLVLGRGVGRPALSGCSYRVRVT